jgi:DNA-binding response OmpR family regulator
MTTCPSRSTGTSWSPGSGPWHDAPRLRRRSSSNDDLSLDPVRRVATRAGRRLDLRPKEFAVLECLLAAQGRPVPAEALLERVRDEAADPFTTTVKTTIRRLRAKLGDPPVIETIRESGYRIGGS